MPACADRRWSLLSWFSVPIVTRRYSEFRFSLTIHYQLTPALAVRFILRSEFHIRIPTANRRIVFKRSKTPFRCISLLYASSSRRFQPHLNVSESISAIAPCSEAEAQPFPWKLKTQTWKLFTNHYPLTTNHLPKPPISHIIKAHFGRIRHHPQLPYGKRSGSQSQTGKWKKLCQK